MHDNDKELKYDITYQDVANGNVSIHFNRTAYGKNGQKKIITSDPKIISPVI